MSFPHGFRWGAATASYQIEGAPKADGKGLSVWDVMCREPGRIWDGHDGSVACNHYHLYEQDVAHMQDIGLRAYRFSVSWPRVVPAGTGTVNQAGLDFYDRLVDQLLEANVEPWLTLFHWDYPYDLYVRGGWLNPESPKWFTDYTAHVVERLSDRVQHWITQNEPQCYIGLGHVQGIHAPGIKLPIAEVTHAAHHSLIAHGLAVQVIRAQAKSESKIGTAIVGVGAIPNSDRSADIEAARHHTFAIDEPTFWNTAWWSDPVVLGKYPKDGLKLFGEHLPAGWEKDLETICQPLDFFGTNIYHAVKVEADENGKPKVSRAQEGYPHTMMSWRMVPEALRWIPTFLHERYGLPIAITENGIALSDWMSLDGKVHDPQRIDFMNRYLLEFGKAIEDGVRGAGYFTWSLMDNFEWTEGYKYRFGLIHVDYATQKRTLKDSAHWYRDVILSNGQALHKHSGPSRKTAEIAVEV